MAQKGVAVVRVATPLGPLELANTHLQANYAVGDYDLVQLGQALQAGALLNGVGTRAHAIPPLIATGDLNVLPHSLPFRALASAASLTPAAPDLDIEAMFARSGSALRLELRELRRMFEEPLELADGRYRRLSDHPALLAEYALARCDGCAPPGLGHEEWGAVSEEALAQLRRDHERTASQIQAERTLAVLAPLLAIPLAWRTWRSRGWLRRAWGLFGCLALLAVAVWLHYWASDFDPWKLERIAALERQLGLKRR
jgi:hypothetical protein